jgi:hypothetical protein
MLHQKPMLFHVGYITHIMVLHHSVKCIAEQSECGTTACHTFPQTNVKLLICTPWKQLRKLMHTN